MDSKFEQFITELEKLLMKYSYSIAEANRALAVIDIRNEERRKNKLKH